MTDAEVQGNAVSKGNTVSKGTRLQEVLDIVCENVAWEWKDLAIELGLSREDIRAIELGDQQQGDQCWHVLCRWRAAKSRAKTVRELLDVLKKCRHRRVADLVEVLCHSTESIDRILGPHMEREGKMREALYLVTDHAAQHWRLLAKSLGLNPQEIAMIERNFEGRTREKCMHALYRWRSLVPLQHFKVASLIQALRACHLNETAVAVQHFAQGTHRSSEVHKNRRKGELHIFVNCEHVDKGSRSSTATSRPANQIRQWPESHENQHAPRHCNGDDKKVVQEMVQETPRPRYAISESILKQYAMNKMFYRLLDALDVQDAMGTHRLVQYLQDTYGAYLTRVSRQDRCFVISCTTRVGVDVLWSEFQSGKLLEVVRESLLLPSMVQEVGVQNIELTITVKEMEYKAVLKDLFT